MRLAVLSDIHGNIVALEAALADLDALGGADHLWILGDLAAFGPRPAECIQRVKDLKDAQVISGNTDRYLVTGERLRTKPAEDEARYAQLSAEWNDRDLALNWALTKMSFDDYTYLLKLKHELSLEAPGCGWVIGYHGTPGNDEGMLTPETDVEEAADALLDREGSLGIGGHIHRQMDRQIGSWRAVNVGSVGLSFEAAGLVQWGLFTFENGALTVDLRRVRYDADAVIADLRACGHPAPERIIGRLKSA